MRHLIVSLICSAAALRPPLSAPRSRPPLSAPRSGKIVSKITGAALAAAFASKNDPKPEQQLSLEDKEQRVIESIRATLDAGKSLKPRRTATALGEFGTASGTLAQTWLTPQACERIVYYWWGSWTILLRDLRRGRVTGGSLRAAGATSTIAAGLWPSMFTC